MSTNKPCIGPLVLGSFFNTKTVPVCINQYFAISDPFSYVVSSVIYTSLLHVVNWSYHQLLYPVTHYAWCWCCQSHFIICIHSSVANPICQGSQSERTFPIFSSFSQFFLIFSCFFPIFGKFFTVKGSLPPPNSGYATVYLPIPWASSDAISPCIANTLLLSTALKERRNFCEWYNFVGDFNLHNQSGVKNKAGPWASCPQNLVRFHKILRPLKMLAHSNTWCAKDKRYQENYIWSWKKESSQLSNYQGHK